MSSFCRTRSCRPLALLAAVALAVGLSLVLATRGEAAAGAITDPAARSPLPDYTLRTLDGDEWRLSEQRGRVVLINLFATWCPPCREEMPFLVRTAEAYAAKGLETVAVSLDRGGEKVVRPFVGQYQMTFPVGFPTGTPSITDGVSGIPVTLLIDRSGRLAQRYVGLVPEQQLLRDLDQLVAEAPGPSRR